MSSMRNATQRRNHRERAQPANREKWGILEKHKDYSLRAKDYNEKKKRLQTLRQKATERNPDEFHYGMLSSKSKQGRKIADRGNPVLSHDAVKLLKTQDSGYLRTMIQKTRRALEKLEKEFVLREGQGAEVLGELDDQKECQHLVFVDTKEDQKQYVPSQKLLSQPGDTRQEEDQSTKLVADEADGDIQMASTTRAPKSRRASEREEAAQKKERLLRKQHKKEQDARRSKLTALKSREKDLIAAESELELQRAKMSNCVGGVTKAGVKWKVRERKK